MRSTAAALAVLMYAMLATADEPRYYFDLPPLRADQALNRLGQQADQQILYPYEMARRSQANRVIGEFTFEEALQTLLEGSGLRVVISQTGDFAIVEDRSVTRQKEMSSVNKNSGLLAMLGALLASGTPDASVAQERGPRVLEEVHITARRVQESLQDTPISVSAFSSQTLEKRHIFSSDALDQITPNLQSTDQTTLAGNNSTSAIFIRGIGQTDPTSSVDPGVGLYIDDVYMGQSIGGSMDFRDIASVQVLRGPQGTLFGKNTIGGAILLTTVEPGDEFGGNLRLGIGGDHLREVFAAVDVPISETLRSRFTAGLRKQDGYVKRILTGEDLGDTNSWTLTGKLVWTPTEKLMARISADFTSEDENGIPFVFAAADETQTFMRAASAEAGCPGFNGVWNALPAVPMIRDLCCANDFMATGPYKNYGTTPLESKTENWGVALHLQYAFSEAVTLKSISSYRKLDWTGVRDADNTPLTILVTDYDSSGEQLSQELQFLYSSGPWQGVIGAYYYKEEVDDVVLVILNTPPPGLHSTVTTT